jgi:hypothetical protein
MVGTFNAVVIILVLAVLLLLAGVVGILAPVF